MWRWTTTRLALNKSTGYRWSPLANPPPAGYDRLYGLHATMNTLRVFAASSSDSSSEVQQMLAPSAAFRHPCRTGGLRCLYIRDFSLENNNNHSAIKEVTVTTKEGETKTKRMKVIPPQYTGLHQLTGLAKYMGVPIRYVPRKELVNLCGERRNQNCVLEVGSFKPIKIESTAELFRKGEEGDTTSPLYVLYLDHIIDPTNVGNLMRTCFFYNIDHVILSKDCSGCTAVVSRASTGFLEYLHVYQSRGSTTDFIKKSKQDDSVSFIATTAHDAGESGAVPKGEDTTVKGKREVRVLVLGNEDKGLANHVVEQCHYTVHLPSPRQRALVKQAKEERVESTTDTKEEEAAAPPPAEDFEAQRQEKQRRLRRLRPKEVTLNVNTACAALLAQLLANTVQLTRVRPAVTEEQKGEGENGGPTVV